MSSSFEGYIIEQKTNLYSFFFCGKRRKVILFLSFFEFFLFENVIVYIFINYDDDDNGDLYFFANIIDDNNNLVQFLVKCIGVNDVTINHFFHKHKYSLPRLRIYCLCKYAEPIYGQQQLVYFNLFVCFQV